MTIHRTRWLVAIAGILSGQTCFADEVVNPLYLLDPDICELDAGDKDAQTDKAQQERIEAIYLSLFTQLQKNFPIAVNSTKDLHHDFPGLLTQRLTDRSLSLSFDLNSDKENPGPTTTPATTAALNQTLNISVPGGAESVVFAKDEVALRFRNSLLRLLEAAYSGGTEHFVVLKNPPGCTDCESYKPRETFEDDSEILKQMFGALRQVNLGTAAIQPDKADKSEVPSSTLADTANAEETDNSDSATPVSSSAPPVQSSLKAPFYVVCRSDTKRIGSETNFPLGLEKASGQADPMAVSTPLVASLEALIRRLSEPYKSEQQTPSDEVRLVWQVPPSDEEFVAPELDRIRLLSQTQRIQQWRLTSGSDQFGESDAEGLKIGTQVDLSTPNNEAGFTINSAIGYSFLYSQRDNVVESSGRNNDLLQSGHDFQITPFIALEQSQHKELVPVYEKDENGNSTSMPRFYADGEMVTTSDSFAYGIISTGVRFDLKTILPGALLPDQILIEETGEPGVWKPGDSVVTLTDRHSPGMRPLGHEASLTLAILTDTFNDVQGTQIAFTWAPPTSFHGHRRLVRIYGPQYALGTVFDNIDILQGTYFKWDFALAGEATDYARAPRDPKSLFATARRTDVDYIRIGGDLDLTLQLNNIFSIPSDDARLALIGGYKFREGVDGNDDTLRIYEAKVRFQDTLNSRYGLSFGYRKGPTLLDPEEKEYLEFELTADF